MKKSTPIIFILALLLLTGCAGPKKTGMTGATGETMKNIPEWFLNTPSDPNYMIAAGTAISRDLQLAKDKAADAARMEIAKAIETKFNGLSKRFQEEVGTDENVQYLDMFTQATKAVVSQVLSGTTVEKTQIVNESGSFRAYILMQMPVGATSQALLNKIKQQEQLYTRFRATQAFDELEEETEKFEQWKEGAAPTGN
ncbi:LPP20 family lipoprotein [bacterium]|nr:LPP20 family lipoprotein [FCB group bacterium]MBL7190902.1 LPP20 family lipoprotein [bacterium]